MQNLTSPHRVIKMAHKKIFITLLHFPDSIFIKEKKIPIHYLSPRNLIKNFPAP